MNILSISCENALRWMSQDFTDDWSTLVQVMAWYSLTWSHYLSLCWPWFISSYGVTSPQWVKLQNLDSRIHCLEKHKLRNSSICPQKLSYSFLLKIPYPCDLLNAALKKCTFFPSKSCIPLKISDNFLYFLRIQETLLYMYFPSSFGKQDALRSWLSSVSLRFLFQV